MERDDRPSVRRLPASGTHVAITIDHASDHNLWSDLTMDVAQGGVFVATFLPLSIGTVVHLLLTLEGDDVPVAASGVVRWSRLHREGADGPAGVGVRFVDLDQQAAEKLARFARDVREPIVFELEEAPMRKRSSRA